MFNSGLLTVSFEKSYFSNIRLSFVTYSAEYKHAVATHMPAGAFPLIKNASSLETCDVCVILRVWSDYPRARRGGRQRCRQTFELLAPYFVLYKTRLHFFL